jgi:hypothetical protein
MVNVMVVVLGENKNVKKTIPCAMVFQTKNFNQLKTKNQINTFFIQITTQRLNFFKFLKINYDYDHFIYWIHPLKHCPMPQD